MEKMRALLNTTCLLVLIYASTKYYQNISNHILKDLEIHSGSVTRKQQRLSFLHVTHLLFDTNAAIKYYQNMSKGIKSMERKIFASGEITT